MKIAALVALAMTAGAPMAQAQQLTDCPAIASKDADGTAYSYNGFLGKQFRLQLSQGAPGDKSVHHITCTAQNAEARDVDCSIKGFSGTLHVNVAGSDSYFGIVGTPNIQVTVKSGQTVKCAMQASNSSN